ncbi:hypothetical protein GGR51DRAFT_541298 [Nemania sp. FL0031]|nr:hypothetical protein GGR51DRAFT_541298 [Nemania sp. FL0031]
MMLPSRGLTRNPASALRYSLSSRTKPTRTISTRQFSQAQSQPSILSGHGLSRTSTSHYGQITPPISAAVRHGASVGIAASVFAQRSGAARNLSLWPFQSKPQNPPAPEATAEWHAQPPVNETTSAASTLSTTAETTSNAAMTPPPPPPADFPNLSQLSDDFAREFDVQSFLDIPERIGFLKELGLDFGWGPTACCEWLLEHVYVYTGLPWWGSIAVVACLFRAVMFYPTLTATKHQARLQTIYATPAYKKAKAAFDEAAFQTKDRQAMMVARAEMKAIVKKSGASPLRMLTNFAMFPFSLGMFRLIRGMAGIPVPGMENGGVAWFTDLTVHDPFFILPSISVALTVLIFKQMQRANIQQNPMQETMMKSMMWIMPPLMFLGTAWLPAGVQWFFLVLSFSTTGQTQATLTPAIRRWAKLPPLPDRDSPAASRSLGPGVEYQKPSLSFREKLQEGVNATSKSLKEATGATDDKARWKKASDYEERRAEEEREKAARRINEIRRRRAERRQ